jgi:hypothetical protein
LATGLQSSIQLQPDLLSEEEKLNTSEKEMLSANRTEQVEVVDAVQSI